MSVICFTCSDTTGAVSPMSNTCYWGILHSLLLPDQNIEHVSFPNPKLYLCSKCTEMLHCMSEFRIVALSSVRTQLEHWNREMDNLSNTPSAVKTEIEMLDIKQEVIDEDPVCDRINKLAGLHEEVMLETTEDVKIEEETLNNTEYNQDAVHWYLGDAGAPSLDDEDGAESEHRVQGWILSESNDEEATDPEDVPRSRAPETSTRTRTRKRSKVPAEKPPPSKKKKNKYNTRLLNKTQLEAYRGQLRRSEEFRTAKHRCTTCLVVFGSKTSMADHQELYHSKKHNLTQCIVCQQTMHSVALAKHIASHFQLIECVRCGHLTDDRESMNYHSCL